MANTATRTRHVDADSPATPAKGRARRRVNLAPYLFVSPFFAVYAVFMVVPVGLGFWISLHSWAGIGDREWLGAANYERLLSDLSFRESLLNTLIYVIAAVFIIMPLSLLLASGLNVRGIRARDTLRVGFFVPIVISPIVVSVLFTVLFDKEFGLINAVLNGVIGFPQIDWFGSPTWAKVAIIVTIAWRWTGYLVIFFLAGLQGIPRELYDAAEVDGCRPWQMFRHVTLPSLRPVTVFVAITVIIGTAQIFEEPYLLTRGGPGESTLSATQFIYRAAFERGEYGYAAAAGVILFGIVFVVTQTLALRLGFYKDE